MGNGIATTGVGVSISALVAVIIGLTPLRARHEVALQRFVTDEVPRIQLAPLDLRIHIELALPRDALRPLASAGFHRGPAPLFAVASACSGGGQRDHDHHQRNN